jgi:hypothetical protein
MFRRNVTGAIFMMEEYIEQANKQAKRLKLLAV